MLDRLVSILPESQRAKAKAWVAWLGAVATVVALVVPDAPEWLAGIFAVLTALGVYGTPNIGYVNPAPGTEGEWHQIDPPAYDGFGAPISNPKEQ